MYARNLNLEVFKMFKVHKVTLKKTLVNSESRENLKVTKKRQKRDMYARNLNLEVSKIVKVHKLTLRKTLVDYENEHFYLKT